MSAAFALLSDACLVVLGGELKRKEKLSGRLADALSNMYLLTAVLKNFEDEGQKQEDLPLLKWACEDCLYNVQEAMKGVLRNFPILGMGWVLNFIIFPLTKPYGGASDTLGHQVSRLLLKPSDTRDRLTRDIHWSQDPDDAMGRLEHALRVVLAAEEPDRKVRDAMKIGLIPKFPISATLAKAVEINIVNREEADRIQAAHDATRNAIRVDEFKFDHTTTSWKPL